MKVNKCDKRSFLVQVMDEKCQVILDTEWEDQCSQVESVEYEEECNQVDTLISYHLGFLL